MPLELLPVNALTALGDDFRVYLKGRRDQEKTIRTYAHYANVLFAEAIRVGLLRADTEVSAPWNPVLVALGKPGAAATVTRYAISIGRRPEQFTLDEIRNWAELMQRRGCSYPYTDNERSRFRSAMAKCGFKQNLCDVFQWLGSYTLSLVELPPSLRTG